MSVALWIKASPMGLVFLPSCSNMDSLLPKQTSGYLFTIMVMLCFISNLLLQEAVKGLFKVLFKCLAFNFLFVTWALSTCFFVLMCITINRRWLLHKPSVVVILLTRLVWRIPNLIKRRCLLFWSALLLVIISFVLQPTTENSGHTFLFDLHGSKHLLSRA